MAEEISGAQRKIDERVLEIAKRRGIEVEKVEDLTSSVRQRIIDSYILDVAKENGYLPKDATIEDLTVGVKEKMKKDGVLDKGVKLFYEDVYPELKDENLYGSNY